LVLFVRQGTREYQYSPYPCPVTLPPKPHPHTPARLAKPAKALPALHEEYMVAPPSPSHQLMRMAAQAQACGAFMCACVRACLCLCLYVRFCVRACACPESMRRRACVAAHQLTREGQFRRRGQMPRDLQRLVRSHALPRLPRPRKPSERWPCRGRRRAHLRDVHACRRVERRSQQRVRLLVDALVVMVHLQMVNEAVRVSLDHARSRHLGLPRPRRAFLKVPGSCGPRL
jgi:hypothetical protein